jgi:hypothetical protein
MPKVNITSLLAIRILLATSSLLRIVISLLKDPAIKIVISPLIDIVDIVKVTINGKLKDKLHG